MPSIRLKIILVTMTRMFVLCLQLCILAKQGSHLTNQLIH